MCRSWVCAAREYFPVASLGVTLGSRMVLLLLVGVLLVLRPEGALLLLLLGVVVKQATPRQQQ